MDSPASQEHSFPPPRKVEGQHYTQVNILFPSSQVELPPAEKLTAFPVEAQKAIILAFNKEQAQRHEWLRNQQRNDHALNIRAQNFNFWWKLSGTVAAGLIVIVTMIGGVYLVKAGASSAGVVMIIGAVASLIGTALFGHRAVSPQPQKSDPPKPKLKRPASD